MRSPLSRLSLKALHAFAVTVRTGSLTRAAGELGITLSAASRLVRGLERDLRSPLLVKDGRGVRPTAAGAALARSLAAGFGEIERGLGSLLARRPDRQIGVSTLPTFAMRWLMPRLADFERHHPGIAVRVEATAALADLSAGAAQVAVRYGRGGWPGLVAHHLFDERLVVVAAPGLIRDEAQGERRGERRNRRRLAALDPADAAGFVGRFPLLTTRARPDDWPAWFQLAGLDPDRYRPGHELEAQTYVVEAVLAGSGLGLVDEALIGRELAGGGLVRLSDVRLVNGRGYWFVRPDGVAPTPDVTVFETWIRTAATAPDAAPLLSMPLSHVPLPRTG